MPDRTQNAGAVEFFLAIPLHGGRQQIVRAFKHDDFSSWCWHGTADGVPFWDTKKTSKKWRVTHIRTGMSIASDQFRLNFKEAGDLAGELEASVEGASQVALSDIGETVAERTIGWRGEPMKQAIEAINRFAARNGKPSPFPAPVPPAPEAGR